MFFFVNTSLNDKKSGIEHAELARLALFKRYGRPAKLVTRNFSLNLHRTMAKAGLLSADVVNLFDFFQGSTDLPPLPVTLQSLGIARNLTVVKVAAEPHSYQVREGDRLVQRIFMQPHDDQAVAHVMTYAGDGTPVKDNWYDSRGFMALEQTLDAAGTVVREQVFNPAGQVVYQTIRTLSPSGTRVTALYRILNYHGQDYQFTGLHDLTRFFLDELNRQTPGKNTFILDRPYELAWSVIHMTTPAYKYLHLHANHVNDPDQPLHGALNYNYDYALKNLAAFDGLITATAAQRQDLQARFGTTPKTYVLPVGYVATDTGRQVHKPLSDRRPDTVVMVARLSPEKQQDQLIEAFVQVVAARPEAQLELWGYTNGDTKKALQALVTDRHLEQHVTFKGYQPIVDQIYNQAQLAVLTSRSEGFSLALLEAQAHGVPTIAYDVNYGPRTITVPGQNGLLVRPNDIDGLAEAIVSLLSDNERRQKMSDMAYQDSRRYGADAVWKAWLTLFDDQEAAQ